MPNLPFSKSSTFSLIPLRKLSPIIVTLCCLNLIFVTPFLQVPTLDAVSMLLFPILPLSKVGIWYIWESSSIRWILSLLWCCDFVWWSQLGISEVLFSSWGFNMISSASVSCRLKLLITVSCRERVCIISLREILWRKAFPAALCCYYCPFVVFKFIWMHCSTHISEWLGRVASPIVLWGSLHQFPFEEVL